MVRKPLALPKIANYYATPINRRSFNYAIWTAMWCTCLFNFDIPDLQLIDILISIGITSNLKVTIKSLDAYKDIDQIKSV